VRQFKIKVSNNAIFWPFSSNVLISSSRTLSSGTQILPAGF